VTQDVTSLTSGHYTVKLGNDLEKVVHTHVPLDKSFLQGVKGVECIVVGLGNHQNLAPGITHSGVWHLHSPPD